MPDEWVFDGWIYQHGNDPVGGPVSTAVLRQMLAAGQLHPADLAWKHLTRGQEVCFSSPIAAKMKVINAKGIDARTYFGRFFRRRSSATANEPPASSASTLTA